ncbi:MAG: hypothetical protein JW801_09105 [Bacteroidales bacterium]|nr:hypothetical protein [Bacteroidales bacterium]
MFLAGDNGYIEILIYAVAVIGGLIVNVYRNYNKRKEQASTPPVREREEPAFPEDIFSPVEEPAETIFPEFIFEEPEVEEAMEEVVIDQAPVFSETTGKLDAIEDEGKAAFLETARQLLDDDQPLDDRFRMSEEMREAFEMREYDYNAEEEQGEGDGFDLRTAVIYSEILNPKYINNSY